MVSGDKSNRSLGRFRIELSHSQILVTSALALILFAAFVVRILPLRWENLSSGTSLLNEFDPYYQFSLTQYMVNHGLLSPYWPTQWINTKMWYPFGYNMGQSSLPSTPITGAALYDIATILGVHMDLMTFCALIPPFVGVACVFVMYYIGKDFGGKTVGLLSALFLAFEPSIIQRTSLGFFDTQVVGTLGLLLFILLFLRSIDSNRTLRATVLYALSAGASLAYFIGGWGGAYYIVGLIPLFVLIIILLKRYSQRLLVSYSVTFGFGLFIATKIPYINLSYLMAYSVLPVAAVFLLLLLAEVLRNNITMKTKLLLAISTIVAILGGFIALFITGYIGRIAGKFDTVIDPFIRVNAQIINSVAEQQITAWGNIYLELGIGILFFLMGLYFTLKNPTNRNIFLLVFATTSLYFAASMIRLLAIFAPAYAVIASIGILGILNPFYTLLREKPHSKIKHRLKVSKEYSAIAIFFIFLIMVSQFAFSPQNGGVPIAIAQSYVPTAISASSLPIGGASLNQPVTAWLDALNWIKTNVPSNNVVVSWWDYGFWLTYLGNCTTLNDNTTGNTTQIENVAFAYMGNENQTMQMLSSYENHDNPGRVNYILVFETLQISSTSSGGSSGYIVSPAGYGDEGKWVWMARISGQSEDRFLQEGYMTSSDAWTNETAFGSINSQTNQWQWNDQGLNCTVEELLNYAQVQYCNNINSQNLGYILTPDHTATTPTYFKEAYFAGLNTPPTQYGGIVPIVAIYSIDWPAYYAATGTTGTGASTG